MAELRRVSYSFLGKCSGVIIISACELQAWRSGRDNYSLFVKPVGCMERCPSWMDAVCLVTQ